MALGACRKVVEARLGRELSKKELNILDEFVKDFDDSVIMSDGEAENAIGYITERLEQAKAAAIIQKRNTALNLKRELVTANYLMNTWRDELYDGIRALTIGSNMRRTGARSHIDVAQKGLSTKYTNGLYNELNKAGVAKVATGGKFDEDIYKALYQINRKDPDQAVLAEIPTEAKKAAEVIAKYLEIARVDANKAGSWIGREDGYAGRRTHDMYKVRKASREQWVNDISQYIDWDKTFKDLPESKRADALNIAYTKISSGSHISLSEGADVVGSGFGSVAKQMSKERVFVFKDAESEIAYNNKYGAGKFMEVIFHQLDHMAAQTALMKKLGPNPRNTLDKAINRIEKQLVKDGDNDALMKLDKGKKFIDKTAWPILTRANRVPANHMLAQVSSTARGIQQMADLGFAAIPALGDPIWGGSELKFQGLTTMSAGVMDGLKNLTHGRTSAERMDILSELGVMLESINHSFSRADITSAEYTGNISKHTTTFFKFNLLTKITDNIRSGFALTAAHRIGRMKEKPFTELPDGLRNMLGNFGIDEGKWDIVRSGELKAADGREYITPEGIDDLPDSMFESYLSGRGEKPTPNRIESLREEIKEQFREYFLDRSLTATLEPDAAVMAATVGGSQAGTPGGEAARQFWMYKTFLVGVLTKVWGREMRGYSPDKKSLTKIMSDALKLQSPEVGGLMNTIMWSTIMGYATLNLREMLQGKEPREITSENWHTVMRDSMIHGGSMGLWTDFVMGEMKDNYGMSSLGRFMGPTFGRVSDAVDLYSDVLAGDAKAGKAFKDLYNTIPYNNHFVIGMGMDYLFGYDMMEWGNPGTLRRIEKFNEQRTGEGYWLPPSERSTALQDLGF